MIRILLVDDQTILCEMMQTWLEREPDFQVVGSAHDGEAAIALVESLQPDIVLLDIQMPEMDGVTATQIIGQRFPDTKVIVLSGYDDDAYLTNAVRAGAKGYLLKNTAAGELANTIRSVHKGYSQVGPGLFERIIARMSAQEDIEAETASSEWAEPDFPESEFRLLLKDFDARALSAVAQRFIERGASDHLFTQLTQHLKREPTNLAALYLAGVFAHRVQGHPLSAFQYLRLGFKEALKQQLSRESLLLFYREGVLLKPEEAFNWLTQIDSLWNYEEGMSFLLQEGAQIFGQESSSYQAILVVGRIRAMRGLSERCTSLSSRLDSLQQGFQRLDKIVPTL